MYGISPQWRRLCGLVLVICSAILAAEVQGISLAGLEFEDSILIEGVQVPLRGLAVKEATFFKVNVYVMGLYAVEPNSSFEELMSLSGPRVLVIRFLRGIERAKLRESWLRDLRAGCEAECEDLLRGAAEIASRLPDVEDGDTVTYVVFPGRVDVFFGGKELGRLPGSAAARAVLGAVVGERAPRKLRGDLLAPIRNAKVSSERPESVGVE